MPHDPNVSSTSGSMSGGETLGRCKQCGAPITMKNIVKGPTGIFCSEACRTQHQNFVQRAAELDDRRSAGGGLTLLKLRRLVGSLIVLAVAAMAAGWLAELYGYRIPFISRFYFAVRGLIGL